MIFELALAFLSANIPIYVLLFWIGLKLGRMVGAVKELEKNIRIIEKTVKVLERKCPLLEEG